MVGLIDVHSHFVPAWYAEEAAAHGHAMPDGMPFWPEWTPEGHLALMDRIGVARSLLSLSTPGVSLGAADANRHLAARVNDEAAALAAARPDRFGFLASLPLPDVDAALAEAARALDELGADGVIVQTSSQGSYVTEPSYEPLWSMLAARRAVVLLHPTSPPGWESTSLGLPRPLMEFLFDSSRVVIGLVLAGTLHRNPGLRLVVPHSGSLVPLLADRAEMFQTGMRALLPPGHPAHDGPPVTEALRDLWWDLAGTPTSTHLAALCGRVGQDRLVYGSDFCFTPESAVVAQTSLLDRSWSEVNETERWRDVVAANAVRLLADG
jgi:6-methylsalicylate decarboxylase